MIKVMNREFLKENEELYEQFLAEYELEDNRNSWEMFVDHYANNYDRFMYNYYESMKERKGEKQWELDTER